MDGIAISLTDVANGKTLIRVFDSKLNETMSIDPKTQFSLEQYVSERCAVSESGGKLACAKGNSIILVNELKVCAQHKNCRPIE